MRDKAPGPDGFRAYFLLQLMGVKEDPSRRYVRDAVASFVRWIASGPDFAARPALAASSLLGIPKPQQPGEIRPLAIGSVWRRAAAALLLKYHRDTIERALGDSQIGFTSCGREAVGLAIRLMLEKHPDFIVFKLDVRNAFNAICRAICLSACLDRAAALLLMARFFYGDTADLPTRTADGTSVSIKSQEGTQQGDPLGGPLFGMGFAREYLEPARAWLARRCPAALLAADWDDVITVAPADVVADFLQWTANGALARAGLTLRPEKCLVWSPHPLSADERAAFPEEVRVAPPSAGIIWAGIPFGTDDFVTSSVRGTIAAQLDLVQDASGAYSHLHGQDKLTALSRSVLARPADLMRMVPPRLLSAALADFDENALRAFCAIIEVPMDTLTPLQRLSVGLPVKGGGFGLRRKTDIMYVAYLSACLAAQGVIQRKWGAQLGDLVRDIETSDLTTAQDIRHCYGVVGACDEDVRDPGRLRRVLEPLLPDGLRNLPSGSGLFAGLQRRLTECIDDVQRLRFLAGSTPEECTWLESSSGSLPGAFLLVKPTLVPSTRLSSRLLANACQRRLFHRQSALANTSARSGFCPAVPARGGLPCARPCDLRGAHLTTCPTGGGSVAIHNSVNEALAQCFRQVLPHHLVLSDHGEILGALRVRLGLLPGDVLPFPVPDIMTLGEDTIYVDTRITEPRGAANMAARGDAAGNAADAAALAKTQQYASAFLGGHMQAHQFVPFALETGGRPCAAADKLLHRLALLHEAKLTNLPLRDKLGPAGNRFLTLLRQIISASLQRAIGRRITTTADRVLFAQTARGRARGDFHVFDALTIADAVAG